MLTTHLHKNEHNMQFWYGLSLTQVASLFFRVEAESWILIIVSVAT